MIFDIRQHFVHYLILTFILCLGAAAFFLADQQPRTQQLIIIALGISYTLWGLIHHLLIDRLHFKIVLEYILIAALGVIIAFYLLSFKL